MNYCTSCGSPIPDGQGSSCSMCYGDPNHGNDGYYQQWLEEQERRAHEQRMLEQQYEERMLEEQQKEILKQQLRESDKKLLLQFYKFISKKTISPNLFTLKLINEFLDKIHNENK